MLCGPVIITGGTDSAGDILAVPDDVIDGWIDHCRFDAEAG